MIAPFPTPFWAGSREARQQPRFQWRCKSPVARQEVSGFMRASAHAKSQWVQLNLIVDKKLMVDTITPSFLVGGTPRSG